jgi:hypothetical protein
MKDNVVLFGVIEKKVRNKEKICVFLIIEQSLHKSDAIQQYHIYLRWQIRAKY